MPSFLNQCSHFLATSKSSSRICTSTNSSPLLLRHLFCLVLLSTMASSFLVQANNAKFLCKFFPPNVPAFFIGTQILLKGKTLENNLKKMRWNLRKCLWDFYFNTMQFLGQKNGELTAFKKGGNGWAGNILFN